jgi:hypothetical protein
VLGKIRSAPFLRHNPKHLETDSYFCQFYGQDIDIKIGFYDLYLGISDDEIIGDPKYHYFADGLKIIRPEIIFAQKRIKSGEGARDVQLMIPFALENPKKWNWTLVMDRDSGTAPQVCANCISRRVYKIFNWLTLEKRRLCYLPPPVILLER